MRLWRLNDLLLELWRTLADRWLMMYERGLRNIFIGKDHVLLLFLLVGDRLVYVVNYTAHLCIPRVMHSNFLLLGWGWQLKLWRWRSSFFNWFCLKAEDMATLVFLIFVRQTDIIVCAAHIPVFLPSARAPLRFLLALRTVQILSFIVHLIFEKTACWNRWRIHHADSLWTTFILESSLELVRPNVKCHVWVIILIARFFVWLITTTVFRFTVILIFMQ